MWVSVFFYFFFCFIFIVFGIGVLLFGWLLGDVCSIWLFVVVLLFCKCGIG